MDSYQFHPKGWRARLTGTFGMAWYRCCSCDGSASEKGSSFFLLNTTPAHGGELFSTTKRFSGVTWFIFRRFPSMYGLR